MSDFLTGAQALLTNAGTVVLIAIVVGMAVSVFALEWYAAADQRKRPPGSLSTAPTPTCRKEPRA